MVEFQQVVGRWSLVVRQSFVHPMLCFGQRPFLACPERSEGTHDQGHRTDSSKSEDEF
jgi:hypothetical protein